ncbi:MAG: hypothetical protein KAT46_04065 [Deltaproteobacteria bacterium]|nr:hypothetical protein [Deltaproteobacteria bacterium]
MTEKSTVKKIIITAIEIEKRLADIYRDFNKRFSADDRIGPFWHSMAEEEATHADFLLNELAMMKVTPESFGDLTIGIESLNKTQEKISEIEDRIKNTDITLIEAVNIAITLENEIVEKKYASIINLKSSALKKIFAELTTDTTKHAETLSLLSRRLKK